MSFSCRFGFGSGLGSFPPGPGLIWQYSYNVVSPFMSSLEVGLIPTPMDIGLNPMFVPTVECWVKSRPYGGWVQSHVVSHICIYVYIYIYSYVYTYTFHFMLRMSLNVYGFGFVIPVDARNPKYKKCLPWRHCPETSLLHSVSWGMVVGNPCMRFDMCTCMALHVVILGEDGQRTCYACRIFSLAAIDVGSFPLFWVLG